MRERRGPWPLLATIHERRALSVQAQWREEKARLQQCRDQLAQAQQRHQQMVNCCQQARESVRARKAAPTVSIPDLLAAERYQTDLQRQGDALAKEVTHCQKACQDQEHRVDDLRKRMKSHEQRADQYRERARMVARAQANRFDEMQDEEVIEALAGRSRDRHSSFMSP